MLTLFSCPSAPLVPLLLILQLLVSHVSHVAEDCHFFPGKALGDGLFHILVVRKPLSRLKLLTIYAALEVGGHIHEAEVSDCVVCSEE